MVFSALVFSLIHHQWEHDQAQVTAPQPTVEFIDHVGIWLAERGLTREDMG